MRSPCFKPDAVLSPSKQLRHMAAEIDGIDVECYRRHGRDAAEPLLGLGDADAKWCFFGRDPGEQEVRLHRPFVGGSGQRIRAVMAEFGLSDHDIFWMNTVPFKPVGNHPWPTDVRRRCQPALLQLLAFWRGTSVITFGEAAFKWFGLGGAQVRRDIELFWKRPDKYDSQLAISLELAGGKRQFTLFPVPHPSGANAIWSRAFPDLLRARLRGGKAGDQRCSIFNTIRST